MKNYDEAKISSRQEPEKRNALVGKGATTVFLRKKKRKYSCVVIYNFIFKFYFRLTSVSVPFFQKILPDIFLNNIKGPSVLIIGSAHQVRN